VHAVTKEQTIDRTVGIETPAAGQDVAVAPSSALSPAESMLNFVAEALHNKDIDHNKLDALLRMQREIVADDARGQFNRALHAAQSEMPRVKKNGTIDLTRKDGTTGGSIPFAKWEDVDAIVRPIAQRYGFSYTFSSEERTRDGGGVNMHGTFRHIAGHSETISMVLPLDTGAGRNNIQAAGSTNSYGRRYLTENFFNIVREGADDDGRAAGTRYIPAETVTAIAEALKKRKIPEHEFVVLLGVRSLEEIEMHDLPRAKNAISSYKPREPVQTP